MAKDYLNIDLGFRDNKKTNRIRRALGNEGPVYPLYLWLYCAVNQPDGDFSDYTFSEIADILKIEVRDGRMRDTGTGAIIRVVKALVETAGFCDPTEGYSDAISGVTITNYETRKVCFRIHDWEEWNKFFQSTKADKSKAANQKWLRYWEMRLAKASNESERAQCELKVSEFRAKVSCEISEPSRAGDTVQNFPPMGDSRGDPPPRESERARVRSTRPGSSNNSRQGVNQADKDSTQSDGHVNGKNGHSKVHPYTRQKAIEELLKTNLEVSEKAKLKFELANIHRVHAGLEPVASFNPPKQKAIPTGKKAKEPNPEQWANAANQMAKVREELAKR